MIRSPIRSALSAGAMALLASACATPPGPTGAGGAGPAGHGSAATVAPAAVSRLHLDARAPAQARVPVAGGPAARAQVALIGVAPVRLELRARCDGPARFRTAPEGPEPGAPPAEPAWAPAGLWMAASLPAGSRSGHWLDMAPGTARCTLQVRASADAPHTLDLVRAGAADGLPMSPGGDSFFASPGGDSFFASPGGDSFFASPRGDCPQARSDDPLTAVFLAPRALSMTCPMAPGPWRLLSDDLAAFDAKAEALTGRRLGAAALGRGDPDMALDFSSAPELDLIVVSYLNLNADFTGALLARMLAHHAARGTSVRILVADPMWRRQDRALFERLAARYPTIQLHPFRYAPRPGDGFEDQIGRLHRVQHTKLFATIARVPGRSRAMIGGRNMADGYVFARPFDLSGWPHLRQYNAASPISAGGFHAYRDLEVEFAGDAQVRALVAHWHELWTREVTGLPGGAARPVAGGGAAPGPTGGGRMRHYLSVPWADGRAQEGLFADLIDAARHRIDIASPYLNPPPRVAAALDAALARGVRVRIVTTERVREPADIFITGLNRMFGARYAGRLTYLDHDPYPRLLHTKAMVIDGRLAVVGSTNLNQRSFFHDTENGVIVMDRAFVAQIGAVIDGYVARSNPIAPDGRVAPLVRALLAWPALRRAF